MPPVTISNMSSVYEGISSICWAFALGVNFLAVNLPFARYHGMGKDNDYPQSASMLSATKFYNPLMRVVSPFKKFLRT